MAVLLEFRDATENDNRFLKDMLYRSALGPHDSLPGPEDNGYADFWRTYETYRKALESEEGKTRVATMGGVQVGAAWYRYYRTRPGLADTGADDIPEVTIAIDEDFRGQGIGRLLMGDLINTAREGGVPALTLNVEVDNGPARHLYESLGFTAFRTEADASISMIHHLQPAQ